MLATSLKSVLSSLRLLSNRNVSKFPQIFTAPEPSMFDEPVDLVIQGLPPLKVITVYATTPVTKNCFYESFAMYRASREGVVDITKDKALHGSYVGVEPTGLLWAMTPYAETKRHLVRFLKIDVTTPQVYQLQVFDEEKQSLEECRSSKVDKSIASAFLNRWFIAPGVRRIPVRENGLVGTLLLPPGDGAFPGLINLFGGYPGVLEYKSALHASHGLASLALAYIGTGNLPMSVLEPLDLAYFEKAITYMKENKFVKSDNGIGIAAICKGAQLALAMSTCLKDIRCIVSINGLCISAAGPIKYKDQNWDIEIIDYSKLIPNEDNDLASCATIPKPGALEFHSKFFPFHKQHHISFLIVSGLSDTCTPTSYFGVEMERLLNKDKHPDFEILKYEDAGHLIEPPNFPYCVSYFQPGKPFNTYITNGGKLMAHCKSQEDAWPKIIKFLKQRLSSKPPVLAAVKSVL